MVKRRSVPGTIIVCVTDFQDPKRGQPENWLWDNFWDTEYSHFSSPHPIYTCLKMHSGSCFWGGPNRELLCIREDTSQEPQGTTLRNGSSTVCQIVTQQLPGRKEKPDPTLMGGSHICLATFYAVKMLHLKKHTGLRTLSTLLTPSLLQVTTKHTGRTKRPPWKGHGRWGERGEDHRNSKQKQARSFKGSLSTAVPCASLLLKEGPETRVQGWVVTWGGGGENRRV